MGMNALRTNDAVLAALQEELNLENKDSYGQEFIFRSGRGDSWFDRLVVSVN